MCICRTCCCGCTLRQGTIGIIIAEGIIFLFQLLGNIVAQLFISFIEDRGGDLNTVRALLWIAIVPTFGRFLFGIISASSAFLPKLRFVHFLAHVICDVLTFILALVLYASSSFSALIIFDILYWALFIYFNFILFSFYKEYEIQKIQEAQNPKSIVVIQQQQPFQGQTVMGQPVYGSVPQQKMADDGNLVGGQPGMLLQPIGAQPMQLMGAQPMQPMGGMSGQPMGGMSGQPMGGAMVGGDPA